MRELVNLLNSCDAGWLCKLGMLQVYKTFSSEAITPFDFSGQICFDANAYERLRTKFTNKIVLIISNSLITIFSNVSTGILFSLWFILHQRENVRIVKKKREPKKHQTSGK